MKSVNAAVKTAIRSNYDVQAVPRLTVEWNWNRYASEISVDNTPSDDDEGYDVEMYPIESLIKPNRPGAGVVKARVGEARTSDYAVVNDPNVRNPRYYMIDESDQYKYWTSPVQTNGAGTFTKVLDAETGTQLSMVRPHVLYPNGVRTNRIVVGIEDTWAAPNDFQIRIKPSASSGWTTISTNPTINAKGQVVLNWNNTWSSANSPANDPATLPVIYGIEVLVNTMGAGRAGSANGFNSYFSLIEISARRVHDLSDRLMSVSDNFDLGEKSLVYPIGTITSNSGQITLFNGDGLFNAESDSLYADLMYPNAQFNLEYVYTVGTTEYPVQQFKMYGDAWRGQRGETVSVDLADYSKFFQETKPNATAFQNATVAQIVSRICDAVGFVDYEIDAIDAFSGIFHIIPIWWCDGEQTVWEVFDELARATQTAIYFDGFGRLQIKSKEEAFYVSGTPAWTLRGENSGTELADIVSLEQTDESQANLIKVSYAQTDIDPVVNGQSRTQVLWQPEGTVTLRACPLFKDLVVNAPYISLPPNEVLVWPFKGMMNVQGEFISYEGKRFVYYQNGDRKTVTVKSADEYKKYNEKTPFSQRYQNHYTGDLVITERGVWNSEERNHYVEAGGYSVRSLSGGTGIGTSGYNTLGFTLHKDESRVYLNPGPNHKTLNDKLVVTRGNTADSPFFFYGTKMRFEKGGGKTQRAGLVINNSGAAENGYFIELTPTAKLTSGKKRAERYELAVYTATNGNWKQLGGKGSPLAIQAGIDYEIDVSIKVNGGDHKLVVWVNGKKAFDEVVTGSDKQANNGKFGMFTRGDSRVSYEYLYAIRREEDDPADDFSFLDKVKGSYQGGLLEREWVYRWKSERVRVKKKWKKIKYRYNISFYDEFGPVVHEIREFNVNFDPKPAITSRLYLGNDYSVICPEYSADSFSARFYLANTIRQNAIAHGEDTLTYAGSGQAVNPILSVIGRSITIADAETVEAKDEDSIRARGEVEVEISSTWIQAKDMAEDLAEWIKNHWSRGADEQSLEIFGNPLIELGDIVSVDYPEVDMSPTTHKYFVVGVQNSFDSGLTTNVTLRRIV